MSPKLVPGATVTPVDKQLVPRKGLARRVAESMRYAITGVEPSTWMSPGQPINPVAQQVQGRTYDYPVGYNNIQRPRSTEGIGFTQLRALADNCDIVRLAIETRKDQIKALKWSFVLKDGGSDDDPRCQALEKFFRRPDRFHDWGQWLGAIIEDLLVIDAPTVYPRRTNGGELYSFNFMDGALFKPLIDDNGLRPMPPDPAYQQWIKGVPAVDYRADEIIYLPRNIRTNRVYGYGPVEQIITMINIAIRRSLTQLDYFTDGTVPPVLLSCPENWTVEQVQQFQKYMDSQWAGDLANKHKARAVGGGAKPTMLRESPLKDEFDEWIARFVMYAFSLPPTAFTRQMNRSTSEQAQSAAEDEGLLPLMQWVDTFMDRIVTDFYGYDDIEFQWQQKKELDPKTQTDIDDKNLRNGSTTIDEVRANRGMDPLPKGIGADPMIYTAQGVVKLADALEQAANPPAPAPIQPGQDAPAPAPVEKLEKKKTDRTRTLAGKLRTALKAAAADVAKQVAGKLGKASTDDRTEEILLGLSFGLDSIWDDYREHIAEQVAESFTDAVVEVGGSDFDPFGLADTRGEQYAESRAAELLGSDGEGGELDDATREMIRGLIADAIGEGWDVDQLSSELSDAYAFSEDRADTIADTEMRMATVGGQLEGWRSTGVVEKKVWLLSGDAGCCDDCQANADQGEIDLDEDFDSGDDGPPAHPNCRCSIAPVTSESNEDSSDE